MSRATEEWIGEMDRLRGRYEARFLAKLTKDELTGCWNWTGARTPKGYGHMKVDGHYERAHRLAFSMYRGEIAVGLQVCHHCDHPRCVNPDHLFLGTPQENTDDKIRKGRARSGVSRGEANKNAKLTAADVMAIRATPKTYGSGRELAKRFGVQEERICDIRAGRSWRVR